MPTLLNRRSFFTLNIKVLTLLTLPRFSHSETSKPYKVTFRTHFMNPTDENQYMAIKEASKMSIDKWVYDQFQKRGLILESSVEHSLKYRDSHFAFSSHESFVAWKKIMDMLDIHQLSEYKQLSWSIEILEKQKLSAQLS